MKTYLSLDLDYFNFKTSQKILKFMDEIRSLSIKPYVVESHEDLLNHVESYKFQELINIDEHSDYSGSHYLNEELGLDCGNWVDFAYCRGRKRFIWIGPKETMVDHDAGCIGRVDNEKCSFAKINGVWPKTTFGLDWRRFVKNCEIVGLGIAASYCAGYCSHKVINILRSSEHWNWLIDNSEQGWLKKIEKTNKFSTGA